MISMMSLLCESNKISDNTITRISNLDTQTQGLRCDRASVQRKDKENKDYHEIYMHVTETEHAIR